MNGQGCALCGAQAACVPSPIGFRCTCERCGKYEILEDVAEDFQDDRKRAEKVVMIAGWVHEQNRAGARWPKLDRDTLAWVASRPKPTLVQRAERLLLSASAAAGDYQVEANLNDQRFLGATYSSGDREVLLLSGILLEDGLVTRQLYRGGALITITPKGHIAVENLTRAPPSQSKQCFVAMNFNKALDDVFSKGIELGVMAAGYDPLRMDKLEHSNRIDDEIIAQIQSSRFMVADFTTHEGSVPAGVFFEAGLALGKGIPVIWTRRADQQEDIHFDLRQFNHILWENPNDLKERLQHRIERMLGPGPNKTRT